MEKQKLLELTAPCSLLCYTCTAYKDGPMGECARKLYSYLDGFGEMRGQFLSEEGRKTWMAQFVEFCSTLQHIGGVCPGCRMEAGPGCIQGCPVPGCISEKGVDFCGECPEFPCQKAGDFFTAQNPRIAAAWEAGSRRIAEIGAEAYFEEKKGCSKETLGRFAEKCAEELRFEDLAHLAPFLPRETLNGLVDRCAEDVSAEGLIVLAPFLSKETLGRFAEKCAEALHFEDLPALAPFLPRETLGGLVEHYAGSIPMEHLLGLAPFLSKETLCRMVTRGAQEKTPEDVTEE